MQVRDFSFSPDDGRLGTISWDQLGLPAVSDQLVSVFSCPASEVVSVDLAKVVVYADVDARQTSWGVLDKLIGGLQAINKVGGHGAAPGQRSWRDVGAIVRCVL